MTTKSTTPSAVPAAATSGHHATGVSAGSSVPAQPTTKPARQAAKAESPNGVLCKNRSLISPAANPTRAPVVGPADKPGANGQQHHEVGGDVIDPQVVAESGLQRGCPAARTRATFRPVDGQPVLTGPPPGCAFTRSGATKQHPHELQVDQVGERVHGYGELQGARRRADRQDRADGDAGGEVLEPADRSSPGRRRVSPARRR